MDTQVPPPHAPEIGPQCTTVTYLAGGDHCQNSSTSSASSSAPDIYTGSSAVSKFNTENRVNAEREEEKIHCGSSDDRNSIMSTLSDSSDSLVGNSGIIEGSQPVFETPCSKDDCVEEEINWTLQDALKEMSSINALYEDRIRWIQKNFTCCPTECLKAVGKINVLTSWLSDLQEQNEALMEIVKDQENAEKFLKESSKACMERLQKQQQDHSLLINSMQDDIKKYRQTNRKLQLDKELAQKSVLAWEAASRTLRKKLSESEAEVAKLVRLLTRIRDQCKWDVTNLDLSPQIHSELFGNHPNLPGSALISETSLESASQESFLLNEKCAGLEVAKEELQLLREKCERTEKLYQEQVKSSTELAANYSRADLLLKDYHNQIEQLKGKIRVFCRIRPFIRAADRSTISVVSAIDEFSVSVQTGKGQKEFNFDRVFPPETPQDRIFEEVKGLVLSAIHGYNVCIAAYGQTGGGKTFTIIGDTSQPGIAPRTSAQIFHIISERESTHETLVSFYAVELYKQKLIDLLSDPVVEQSFENETPMASGSTGGKLEIRRDSDGIVHIQGCSIIQVENSGRLLEKMMLALDSRHTSVTTMNDRSSRSHLILGIIIESTCKINGTVTRGKISLLDLAGSERQGKIMSSGVTFQESKLINKSLSALEHVIVALTTEQPHVPYRNNKLTELLQDSIGGNAKTLFIINVSPSRSNLDETLVSLNYGMRIKQVVNYPQRANNSNNSKEGAGPESHARSRK